MNGQFENGFAWETGGVSGRLVRVGAVLRTPEHYAHGWASQLGALSGYPSQCGCGDMIDATVLEAVADDVDDVERVARELAARLGEEFAERSGRRERVVAALTRQAREVLAGRGCVYVEGEEDEAGVWVVVDSSPRRAGLVAWEWGTGIGEDDFAASAVYLDQVYSPGQVAAVRDALTRFHGYDPDSARISHRHADELARR